MDKAPQLDATRSIGPAGRLAGKVALITGASRGLGRAIAIAFARAGARTALVARSAADLGQTAGEIAAVGADACAVPVDVTAEGAAQRAIGTVVERFGAVDVLVMSTGTAVTRPALELTLEEWDHVLNVNLRAAFVWSQAVGRQMSRTGGGRILHLASVTGQVGAANLAAYCASKGGLIAMTRALAVEWARYGITVNALAPGYVETARVTGLRIRVVLEKGVCEDPIDERRLGRGQP